MTAAADATAQRARPQPLAAEDSGDVSWKRELRLPGDRAQASILRDLLATPVPAFDPGLPPVPLDGWLFLTLAPLVEQLQSRLAVWQITFCDDTRSAIPGPGPELCADGTVRVAADRDVRLVFAVADAVRDARSRRLAWQRKNPSLRDVYVERVEELMPRDSLDVPALGALADLVRMPFELWPAVEFETAISWSPLRPTPGDTVKFRIAVRNASRRNVDRAEVNIVIEPCCGETEFRRNWFPHIAAGETVYFDAEIVLPDGMTTAIASVRPGPGTKLVRDASGDRATTVVQVGYPPQ